MARFERRDDRESFSVRRAGRESLRFAWLAITDLQGSGPVSSGLSADTVVVYNAFFSNSVEGDLTNRMPADAPPAPPCGGRGFPPAPAYLPH
jgi:hypothetical protein